MNYESIFSSLGLTGQESRIYLALLSLGEAQTGKLCTTTGIASSNIYALLDRLIDRGLVSFRVENNIKVYMPSPPEALNELFIKKQEELEIHRKSLQEAILHLKKQKKSHPQSRYKYYQGVNGIKSMWHEINETLTAESEEFVYGTSRHAYERLIGFYDEHHKIRDERHVHARLLLPMQDKELQNKRKSEYTEIGFAELSNEAEWGIVDDMIYMSYYTDKVPKAFLLKDKIFAKTFKQVFLQVWKQRIVPE